ncbi:A/G-specific adenine glycosylase [Desulfosporosinus sp. PR]|uniref:A/G-specific adenine glycosylase n=1 Tax=Candidatus Desulfosporosinus nitrosoreducens TaxID=3401928 RepID=UPI0027F0664C|nr:A/G-specific adenine glycosylase [Desulfosporosinus sp. PR]MDQ7096435.1 A/G-specific adenine glycosylase [Desulfosporosinus sp. PR]
MTIQKETENLPAGSSVADLLLTWYDERKRDLPWRRTKDPYVIWVSEVMLQQTQVKTVIPYFERFLLRFPNVRKLGEASLEDVLTVWQGLGYYSRARRMWEGAHYLLTQWSGRMPDSFAGLLQVPGIGKYTAGAIASIAYGQNVSAIDGNVLRVVSRLLAWPEPVEAVKSYRHFDRQIAAWQSALRPGDFNQGLMELGAMVCTPVRPDCAGCPLVQVCQGYKRGDLLAYPVKKIKPQRQEVTRLTFVLRCGDRVYLQKRPPEGLLANLWEFPGVEFLQEVSLSEALPVLTQAEWLQLFQDAVTDRSFDRDVQSLMARGLHLQGPVWYNFSHRRWKILWLIFDLNKTCSGQKFACETGGEFKPESAQTQKHNYEEEPLKEVEGNYLVKKLNQHLPEQSRCWISLSDLGQIPLPVAFRGILEGLIK